MNVFDKKSGKWPEPGTPPAETVTKSPPMEYVAIQLPPQPDAPNVFRYACPACKCNVSLYSRMGAWFVKAVGR